MKKNSYQAIMALGEQFGDSFYLLDTDQFRNNFRAFLSSFREHYANVNIGYSYKTNYIPQLCRIVNEEGGYAEVVSEMEYDLALKVGVSPSMIIVNGPYKTRAQLFKFLNLGSVVHVDSYNELEIVKAIASELKDKTVNISFRVNFSIDNGNTSRFGFDVTDKIFFEQLNEIKKIKNIVMLGIHCHYPDRNLESYSIRVEKILSLVDEIFELPPKYIDIGGGYFGKIDSSLEEYFGTTPSFEDYAGIIAGKFSEHFSHIDDSLKPQLILEPGSAIVADTMQFVCKIIDVKAVRGKAIAMSSGSKFNMGAFSSKINMPMEVLSNLQNVKEFSSIDISGYTCIEADYLYRGYKGSVSVGDYLVFSNVGSYSVVFKPPFIMPNVPVLDIGNDSYGTVLKRQETVEDIFSTYFI